MRLAKSLLRSKALVDKQNVLGETPVMIECRGKLKGHHKVLDLSLSQGARLEIRHHGDNTAPIHAIESRNAGDVQK